MKRNSYAEGGSALVYILIAIALLAALTATFMSSSSQQTTSQGTFNTASELGSQASLIRSAIQECVLTYPSGDDGLVGAPNTPYPLNPSDSYLQDPAANDNVENLRCPGNPGNSANHARIFGGTTGKFLAPAPNLFEPWQYYNGTDGVFFYTRTNKTDAHLRTAMERLDEQFSQCEADMITGPANLTSGGAGSATCASGYTCFRVWMIVRPSRVYPSAAEASCP